MLIQIRSAICFVFILLALGCVKQGERSSRELVDVVFAAPNDSVGVFVWTEPASRSGATVYFGAKRVEGKTTYDQVLETVEPFGKADFSKSVVKYGWNPDRVFTVCANNSDILPIPNPEDFAESVNSTSFGGSNCDDEFFASFPPST